MGQTDKGLCYFSEEIQNEKIKMGKDAHTNRRDSLAICTSYATTERREMEAENLKSLL